jgi:lipopolysaccharide biosynthesis glycosyltransferase
MKKNLLVTLATKNYVNQAKQLFSSAYWNGGWDGDYMLLSFEIPEKKLKWFRKKGILIYKCERLYPKSNIIKNRIIERKDSIICLNKFYLFTKYFKKWNNIIYLDSDIIVKSSLEKLKNITGFNATLDYLTFLNFQIIEHNNLNQKDRATLERLKKNYDLNEKAFNAGVFVFNSEIIKKDSFNRLKILFKNYKDVIKNSDQTILNLYFNKNWKELPIVFNTHSSLILKNPKIKNIITHICYNPPTKRPWEKNSPFYNEWKENLDKADLMDIKKPIFPSLRLTKKEIKKYSRLLKGNPGIIYNIIKEIDKYIGQIGLFLKKKIPKLYFILKRLKEM